MKLIFFFLLIVIPTLGNSQIIAKNKIDIVFTNEKVAPILDKIVFYNKETGVLVNEFLVKENNPYRNYDISDVENLIEEQNLSHEYPYGFHGHTHGFDFYSNAFALSPLKVNTSEIDNFFVVWYSLFVTENAKTSNCGENEIIHTQTKFIVLNNNGISVYEGEDFKYGTIHQAVVSEDGKYLIFRYEDTVSKNNSGFIIYDLVLDKTIFDYRSDTTYNTRIATISAVSNNLWKLMTFRKSQDKPGMTIYVNTDERIVKGYPYTTNFSDTNRRVSTSFDKNGITYKYKNGTEEIVPLSDFLEIFHWE